MTFGLPLRTRQAIVAIGPSSLGGVAFRSTLWGEDPTGTWLMWGAAVVGLLFLVLLLVPRLAGRAGAPPARASTRLRMPAGSYPAGRTAYAAVMARKVSSGSRSSLDVDGFDVRISNPERSTSAWRDQLDLILRGCRPGHRQCAAERPCMPHRFLTGSTARRSTRSGCLRCAAVGGDLRLFFPRWGCTPTIQCDAPG